MLANLEDKSKLWQKFLGFMTSSPIIIAYFILIDIFFLVNSAVIKPLLIMIRVVSCGAINTRKAIDAINTGYKKAFGMTDYDRKGFRRLRTIS